MVAKLKPVAYFLAGLPMDLRDVAAAKNATDAALWIIPNIHLILNLVQAKKNICIVFI